MNTPTDKPLCPFCGGAIKQHIFPLFGDCPSCQVTLPMDTWRKRPVYSADAALQIVECANLLTWASWLESISPKAKGEIDSIATRLREIAQASAESFEEVHARYFKDLAPASADAPAPQATPSASAAETPRMKCRLCGRTVHEIKGFLQRVNEKGVAGIWECRPSCDTNITNEEAVLLAVSSGDLEKENLELKDSYLALTHEVAPLEAQLEIVTANRDHYKSLWEVLIASRERDKEEIARLTKERDEAVHYSTALKADLDDEVTRGDTARAQLKEARDALQHYKEGDEHADKEEFVAAASHYDEGDRIRDDLFSTAPPASQPQQP